MGEIKTGDNSEIKGMKELPCQKIKPENGMNVDQAKNHWNELFKFDIKENANTETKLFTTYEERISRTPIIECGYGSWEGDRGESKFIPNSSEVKAKLAEYGMNGVEYKNGIPNFHPCSEATVEIDMTWNRPAFNFPRADKACAEKWNELAKDGKTDWKASDVRQWRHDNSYSWHECSDMKTCELVPQEIHDVCRHSGGVAECIKRDGANGIGGGFDD